MSIVCFTLQKHAALTFRPVLGIELVDAGAIKSYKPARGDLAYLDVSGMDENERKKALSALQKRCNETAWAVLDPGGLVEDPAALFFMGASDYAGPTVCRTGLDKARIRAALEYFAERINRKTTDGSVSRPRSCLDDRSEGRFEGWKSVQPGLTHTFLFIHVAVSAHMNLKTRLGESGYRTFRDKLRQFVQQALAESDPLLWMETDAGALYLVPPLARNAEAATEACLRMLLGSPLIAYERFGLPFPIRFSFAAHYGPTEFAPPGKTGTIVSEAVNYSFHLGTRRAEPGRLTVSSEAAPLVVARGFEDIFVPSGSFEGQPVLHSKLFATR